MIALADDRERELNAAEAATCYNTPTAIVESYLRLWNLYDSLRRDVQVGRATGLLGVSGRHQGLCERAQRATDEARDWLIALIEANGQLIYSEAHGLFTIQKLGKHKFIKRMRAGVPLDRCASPLGPGSATVTAPPGRWAGSHRRRP